MKLYHIDRDLEDFCERQRCRLRDALDRRERRIIRARGIDRQILETAQVNSTSDELTIECRGHAHGHGGGPEWREKNL